MRGQLWSPGRPSKARREDRVRFWEAIAGGVSSEDAAAGAGVSPAVGSRWFRQAGGMPPISLGSVSGRYLSFTEREEIAIFCAQGVGVREIGRRVGRCASPTRTRPDPPIWSTVASRRTARTVCGSPTSPMFGPGRASRMCKAEAR